MLSRQKVLKFQKAETDQKDESELGPLARTIGVFLDLTEEEISALDALNRQKIHLAAQQDLYLEGDAIDRTYVLLHGWMCRHRTLEDGRRQIMSFVLPGDLLNHFGAYQPTTIHTVTALTDAVLASFSCHDIVSLSRAYPRLGAAFAWLGARKYSLLEEHVVRIGRRNAYERIAHMLLELLHCLNVVDDSCEDGYELPVTQEILGDALGLSLVHVNRTLRRLRKEGLIQMDSNRRIVILDMDALTEIAEFSPDYLQHRSIPILTEENLQKVG
ncbi:MAG: Crp/Fnr family transcriptional regulator [Proteobacteria bacterium]|nr:Crp/Fnr family transcriptional regulator [Pseudomonadota bacterium]